MFTKLMNAVRILRLPFMAILTPLMAFSILLNQTCGNEEATSSCILSSNSLYNMSLYLYLFNFGFDAFLRHYFYVMFRVGTFKKWGKAITYAEDGCGSWKCFKGAYPDFFQSMQSQFNFTFKVILSSDTGKESLDGSWTGIIG